MEGEGKLRMNGEWKSRVDGGSECDWTARDGPVDGDS
jgi:hypothetical protein